MRLFHTISADITIFLSLVLETVKEATKKRGEWSPPTVIADSSTWDLFYNCHLTGGSSVRWLHLLLKRPRKPESFVFSSTLLQPTFPRGSLVSQHAKWICSVHDFGKNIQSRQPCLWWEKQIN